MLNLSLHNKWLQKKEQSNLFLQGSQLRQFYFSRGKENIYFTLCQNSESKVALGRMNYRSNVSIIHCKLHGFNEACCSAESQFSDQISSCRSGEIMSANW